MRNLVELYRGTQLGKLIGDFFAPTFAASLGQPYSRAEITDIERQEPWVWASIDLGLVVTQMAGQRIWAGDPAKPSTKEAERGPLHEILERPNAVADSTSLIAWDWLNLILSGESYWFLSGPDGQPVQPVGVGAQARIEIPTSIWPVSGNVVGVEYDKTTGLPSFYTAPGNGGQRVRYPAGAVHSIFHRPDPNRPHRGIGPLASALGPAAQNYIARRYTDRLLRNDGRVAGILIVGGFPSNDKLREMRDDLDETWNNPENAGKWRLASGDNTKVHSEPTTPRDMEFQGLIAENKADLAAILQTPSALLGADTTNFATFAGHFRRYVELRIVPWLETRARTINERFIPRLREPRVASLRVSYDIERMRQITADPREQGEAARAFTSVGMPISEALRTAGIRTEKIEGGDVPMVNASQIPLLDAQARGRALAVQAQAEAASALKALGVDPDEALAYCGLDLQVSEEQEAENAEAAAEAAEEIATDKPAKGNDKKAGAEPKGLPLPGEARGNRTSSADAAPAPILRYTQTVDDRATTHEEKRARRAQKRKLNSALRGIYWRMRQEQLRALERFAASGERPERSFSVEPPAAYMPRSSAEDLLTAHRENTVEQWVERFPRIHARLGGERALSLALSIVRGWSEQEIESLVVAGSAKWREAISEALYPSYVSAYSDSAARTRVNVGLSSRVIPEEVLTALRDKAIRVAEGIQSTASEAVRAALIRALAAGQGAIGGREGLQAAVKAALEEIKAGTTGAFATLSARALTIARTEVNGASAQANYKELLDSYRKGLIRAVRWLTSGRGPAPDGTVRDSHFDMEGQEVVPGTYFVSGRGNNALHPYGFGIASEDISCECRLQGVLADGDTDNTVRAGTSDDSPVLEAKEIEAIVRAHEDQIVRHKDHERAVVVDSKGRVVVSKIGKGAEVRFTAAEQARLAGTVFTHNHPRGWQYPAANPMRALGTSLSINDVLFAAKNKVAEVRAVSPSWIHSLKPGVGKSWPDLKTLAETVYRLDSELEDAKRGFIAAAKTQTWRLHLIDWANATHAHELMELLARELGLIYKREPLNA